MRKMSRLEHGPHTWSSRVEYGIQDSATPACPVCFPAGVRDDHGQGLQYENQYGMPVLVPSAGVQVPNTRTIRKHSTVLPEYSSMKLCYEAVRYHCTSMLRPFTLYHTGSTWIYSTLADEYHVSYLELGMSRMLERYCYCTLNSELFIS